MKSVSNDSPELVWSGAISLRQTNDHTHPWRLPQDRLEFFPFAKLQLKASQPAGVRLRFATDSQSLTFHTEPAEWEKGNLDLYSDGQLIETRDFVQGDSEYAFENLPSGMKVIELWLHMITPFKLKSIDIDDNSSIERSEDKRPKWITYGSSITHCGGAGSPSFTWPGVASRQKGLDLTCLGFGGECHADPMISKVIRDFPADFISLELGANIYGTSSMSLRTFRPALIGFIATVREKHPETPLAVISPIYSPVRETTKNKVDLTYLDVRSEVEAAVDAFLKHGDKNLYYIDGLRLYETEWAKYMPDKLHPDATGNKLLGERFAKVVFKETGMIL